MCTLWAVDHTETETINGETRSRTVTHYYQNSHIFFKASADVNFVVWNGNRLLNSTHFLSAFVSAGEQTSFCLWDIPSDHLQPGQYSVPFSIVLPQVLELSELHSQEVKVLSLRFPSLPLLFFFLAAKP